MLTNVCALDQEMDRCLLLPVRVCLCLCVLNDGIFLPSHTLSHTLFAPFSSYITKSDVLPTPTHKHIRSG